MTPSQQRVVAIIGMFAFAGLLAWWVYGQVAPTPLTLTPQPTELPSPFQPTLLEALRQRTVYGELPVTPAEVSDRSDPFVQ
jgi:hypothetical protein